MTLEIVAVCLLRLSAFGITYYVSQGRLGNAAVTKCPQILTLTTSQVYFSSYYTLPLPLALLHNLLGTRGIGFLHLPVLLVLPLSHSLLPALEGDSLEL